MLIPLSYLSDVSNLDTKYDRYDKYDSYCAISFSLDRTANPNSIRVFNLHTAPIMPVWHLMPAKGAMGAGCGVVLAVRGRRNAISTHAPIPSGTVPLLSLSGVNY